MAKILSKKKVDRLEHRASVPWKTILLIVVIALLTAWIVRLWHSANAPENKFEYIDKDTAYLIIDKIKEAQERYRNGPVDETRALKMSWEPGYFAAGIDDLYRAGVLEEFSVKKAVTIEKPEVEEVTVGKYVEGAKPKKVYVKKVAPEMLKTITPDDLIAASSVHNIREIKDPSAPINGYYFTILCRYLTAKGKIVDLEKIHYVDSENPSNRESHLDGGYAILAYPKQFKDIDTTPIIVYLKITGDEPAEYTWTLKKDPKKYKIVEMKNWDIAPWGGAPAEDDFEDAGQSGNTPPADNAADSRLRARQKNHRKPAAHTAPGENEPEDISPDDLHLPTLLK